MSYLSDPGYFRADDMVRVLRDILAKSGLYEAEKLED